MKKFLLNNVTKTIILAFLIWRIGLFIIAWLGSLWYPFLPSFPYSGGLLIDSGLPPWLWSFANFDGVHYITIAESGYSAQFTQVFFPVYPLLIMLLDTILPFFITIINGLIISNVSFLLALFIFYKLLKLDYSKYTIFWILLFLLSFPTSFFYGSLYTEGFFILSLVSSFYFARQKRWWAAGLIGAVASATRLVGIFLLPALLWEWQRDKFKVQSASWWTKFKVKDQKSKYKYYLSLFHWQIVSLMHSPILYLIPIGIVSYMIYLQIAFGDALYFWHAQPVFGAQRSGSEIIILPQVIWRYIKILFTVTTDKHEFWVALSELSFSLFAILIMAVATLKKIRPSYLIFSWLAVLIPTLSGTFSSMPRYVSIAFPLYIILGKIENIYFKMVLITIFIILLSIYTIVFTRGSWIS